MKCVEGNSLTVTVFVSALPPPKITVYHNNDLVVCANQLEPVRAEQPNLYSFAFIIDQVHPEDSGKIMFNATNPWGSDECTTYLEIADNVKRSNNSKIHYISFFFFKNSLSYGAELFFSSEFSKFDTNTLFEREFEAAEVIWSVTDVTVAEGGTAWLYGKLCGYPVPELIWLKNGVELNLTSPAGKYQAELKSGEFLLLLPRYNNFIFANYVS
ncbi:unnamed protein product [Strongylus vulgaris]|uniref:Immunoglobulin I-set domain-containing protein n=1 Tax=Strongylus vulgaris TaxID=40348 RepID=A0A3P7J298_STRVU|nr:unnamed protein product [Strongylus vulgaris]